MEDIVAIAAKSGTGVMLRILRFVKRRFGIVQRAPLDIPRVQHDGCIAMFQNAGLLNIGTRYRMTDITRDSLLTDRIGAKCTMFALVWIKCDRPADRTRW